MADLSRRNKIIVTFVVVLLYVLIALLGLGKHSQGPRYIGPHH